MTSPTAWSGPGSWTALCADSIWVLVDAGNDQQLVTDLWAAISAPDATADHVLGSVLGRGLHDLPGLAIASTAGEQVRILVRHPASAQIDDGAEVISAEHASTWVDTTRPLPANVTLEASAATEGLRLPLILGASSAGSLNIEFAEIVDHEPAADAGPEANDVPEDATAFMSAAEILAEEPSLADEPVATPRRSLGNIVMPSGDKIPVDDGIMIGRAPRPTEGTQQQVIAIPMSGAISRNHVEVTVDQGGVFVRDLNTPNGTTLAGPGQPPMQLTGDQRYPISAGAEIDLADVVTVRFEAAD